MAPFAESIAHMFGSRLAVSSDFPLPAWCPPAARLVFHFAFLRISCVFFVFDFFLAFLALGPGLVPARCLHGSATDLVEELPPR